MKQLLASYNDKSSNCSTLFYYIFLKMHIWLENYEFTFVSLFLNDWIDYFMEILLKWYRIITFNKQCLLSTSLYHILSQLNFSLYYISSISITLGMMFSLRGQASEVNIILRNNCQPLPKGHRAAINFPKNEYFPLSTFFWWEK